MLDTLPVEISFVDDNDVVRYFSKDGDWNFPRPRSVIGNRMQNCHPHESVDKVEQILREMKAKATPPSSGST